MSDTTLIEVTPENLAQYGLFCVKSKKHPGNQSKLTWYEQQYPNGLRVFLLRQGKQQVGMIEVAPVEYNWRKITGKKFWVIHCLWVDSKKYPGGSKELLAQVEHEAQERKLSGLVVLASNGSFMAGDRVFLKNGFESIQTEEDYLLLGKRWRKTPWPTLIKAPKKAARGLRLAYVPQCPYIGKAVLELPPVAKAFDQHLTLHEITSPQDQGDEMLSPYGVFNLSYNGELLADHPISATRFKNILQKDLHLRPIG